MTLRLLTCGLLALAVGCAARTGTNAINSGGDMKLLAKGDRYFVHLVRRTTTRDPRHSKAAPFVLPSGVVVHTSRPDGRMRQLFAEGTYLWTFVGGINRDGSRTATIDDAKADKERLYLLVRSTGSSSEMRIRTTVTVSLTLHTFWLADGHLLGEFQLRSSSSSDGKTPSVPKGSLKLRENGVSCQGKTWRFDGKRPVKAAANKPAAGDS